MIITCPKHGDFLQNPNLHISQKCGCPKCSYGENRGMGDRYKDNVEDYHECIRSLLVELGRHDIARVYAERVDEAFNDRQISRIREMKRREAEV